MSSPASPPRTIAHKMQRETAYRQVAESQVLTYRQLVSGNYGCSALDREDCSCHLPLLRIPLRPP